jgi:hypothetical protein
MVRLFTKNGWGMSDGQYLGFMFGKDLVTKAAMIYQMKKAFGFTIEMMEKFDELNDQLEETEQSDMKENKKEMCEGLSDKGVEKIQSWCDSLGCRQTAVKLVDICLNKMVGLSSSDLSDTSTFANGLDEIETQLEDGDYQSAFNMAKETAREMLDDEGYPMEMDEKLVGKQSKLDKNKNGKIDSQDFKMLRKDKNEDDSEDESSNKDDDKKPKKKEDKPKEFRPGVDLGKSFEKFKKMNDMKEEGDVEENAFVLAADAAKDAGEKEFEFPKGSGKMHKVTIKQDIPEEDEDENRSSCNECGGQLNEEGSCNECGYGSMKESKKKVVRLTETQLIDAIKKIVKESVPGLREYKKAHDASGKSNKSSVSDVSKKMKDYLTFEGNDNPEFPNQIKKGDKMAINNTKEQDEVVDKERGRALQDLKYDNEPSENFKKRMKMAIEGDKLMGNESKEMGNVVPKKGTSERLLKGVKNKKEELDNRVLYNKERVPVKTVNESKGKLESILDEEVDRIMKIQSYNKKTQ